MVIYGNPPFSLSNYFFLFLYHIVGNIANSHLKVDYVNYKISNYIIMVNNFNIWYISHSFHYIKICKIISSASPV